MGTFARGQVLPIAAGDVLDNRYEVRRRLGTGGSGTVYHVFDRMVKGECALKVIAIEPGRANPAMDQIIHEYRLRKGIADMAHVIKSEDPRPTKYKWLDLVLLPMELASGGSLRDWMGRNPSVDERRPNGLDLIQGACLGTKAIHEVGLVHLDIKPENIMIVGDEAKISDLGVGRYGAERFAANPDQILRPGIGTPEYMSPEQFRVARQKEIGPASDIYSLGVVLYELLDGHRPFDGSATELREKHLNVPPPPLRGTAAPWRRIVERCLQKKPEDRYSSVEALIKDLDGVAQGAIPSAHVACPKCGYINANVNTTECEKCGTNLAKLFRPCPRCARQVRLDLDVCPGCGQKGIAAYYLLLKRKQRIDKLRDEDPVEAIELLEIVLGAGAGNYEKEATELVLELRAKQGTIADTISRARKAETEGRLEEAIAACQDVLAVIPRHRMACEQKERLEALLSNVNQDREMAVALLAEARFQEAHQLLAKCLELIPSQKEIRRLLDDSHRRAKEHTSAISRAQMFMHDRAMLSAARQVEAALAQAPKSREALALKQRIAKTMNTAGDLLKQAGVSVPRAEFDEAQALIRMSEGLQLDHEGLSQVKTNLPETKRNYTQAMQEAEKANQNRDLDVAANQVRAALEQCPESAHAKTLSGAIKRDQERTRQLILEAETAIRSADFDGAEMKLRLAEEVWRTYEAIVEVKTALANTRIKYEGCMNRAAGANSSGNLADALREAENAHNLCSDSHAAKALMKAIKQGQNAARNLLNAAMKYLKAAEFEKAREQLERARQVGAKAERIGQAQSEIGSTQVRYREQMERATKAYHTGALTTAQIACEIALDACPEAAEAEALKLRIQTRRHEESLERNRQSPQPSPSPWRPATSQRPAKNTALIAVKGLAMTVGAFLFCLGVGWGTIQLLGYDASQWRADKALPKAVLLVIFLLLSFAVVGIHAARNTRLFGVFVRLSRRPRADLLSFFMAWFALVPLSLVVGAWCTAILTGSSSQLPAALVMVLAMSVETVFLVHACITGT